MQLPLSSPSLSTTCLGRQTSPEYRLALCTHRVTEHIQRLSYSHGGVEMKAEMATTYPQT